MKIGTPKIVQPEGAWAALLSKELAPAKRPEGGKTISEIREMRRKLKLPCGLTGCSQFLREQIKAGKLKMVNVYERKGDGQRTKSVYYVPTK